MKSDEDSFPCDDLLPSKELENTNRGVEAVPISIDLTDDQSKRLEELARSLAVDPRELARAAVNSLLTQPADDFDRAASYVLEKNKELYERLS